MAIEIGRERRCMLSNDPLGIILLHIASGCSVVPVLAGKMES